jgi:sec-independent protein translocase protein TatA
MGSAPAGRHLQVVAPRTDPTVAMVLISWPKEHSMGSLGLPEMLIILFIIILIFGANRLPDIGRGIGRGIKNFKESVKDGREREQEH